VVGWGAAIFALVLGILLIDAVSATYQVASTRAAHQYLLAELERQGLEPHGNRVSD
jgi:hypothetical protein